MTIWTVVDDVSTSYTAPSDEENNYVVFGYMANDYISGSAIWDVVDSVSTTWNPA